MLCYDHGHVSPGLVVVGHRVPTYMAVTEPSHPGRHLAAGPPPRHGAGVAPPTARLSHPGDVYFGPLKPISFIPWLRIVPTGPTGLTKQPKSMELRLSSTAMFLALPEGIYGMLRYSYMLFRFCHRKFDEWCTRWKEITRTSIVVQRHSATSQLARVKS